VALAAGQGIAASAYEEACGWAGRNSVICTSDNIAALSVTGSPIIARDGNSMRNSGCLTKCRSPLDMTISNGSNGRRLSISRIASAFTEFAFR